MTAGDAAQGDGKAVMLATSEVGEDLLWAFAPFARLYRFAGPGALEQICTRVVLLSGHWSGLLVG